MTSVKSTKIEVPLGSYTIKGVFTEGLNDNGFCAIFLHPHPRYGGDITNHVITQLEQACQEDGLSTFKFSFRGAESNPHGYQGVDGSRDDVIACIEYLEDELKISSFGLIGYSYGGSVALSAALVSNAKFLVTLSASATLFNETGTSLDELIGLKCPIMMFHGVDDMVVKFNDMKLIQSSIKSNVHSIPLADEGHFYQKSLPIVIDELRRFFNLM